MWLAECRETKATVDVRYLMVLDPEWAGGDLGELSFIEAGCRGRENPGLRAGDESYPALSYEFLNTITA